MSKDIGRQCQWHDLNPHLPDSRALVLSHFPLPPPFPLPDPWTLSHEATRSQKHSLRPATVKRKAPIFRCDLSLKSSQSRETEAGNYLVAGGQCSQGQKPKGIDSLVQISVLALPRLLLNFVVFSNLFTQKRSFQTQCLLGGDILIFIRSSNRTD